MDIHAECRFSRVLFLLEIRFGEDNGKISWQILRKRDKISPKESQQAITTNKLDPYKKNVQTTCIGVSKVITRVTCIKVLILNVYSGRFGRINAFIDILANSIFWRT